MAPAESILITLARAALQKRRYEEADRAYARALGAEPESLEALEYLYARALGRGAAGEAERLLAQAAQHHPQSLEVQTSHAALLLRTGAIEAAEQVLLAILAHHPQAPTPRLFLGSIAEQRARPRIALQYYFRAVTLAQLQGQWNDEASTAPELLELVGHAMRTVVRGRASLFDAVLEPLRAAYGSESIERVAAGLQMYLGDRPTVTGDVLQRPKFLYVPGLRDAAFADLSPMQWIEPLQQQLAPLREECLAVMHEGTDIEPFLKLSQREKQADYLDLRNAGSAWDAYFFYRHGERFESCHVRCPATARALSQMPLPLIAEHAPEVCFSILRPGTRILPHHGVTNTRLVMHLPLVVPSDCALRVGRETHRWQEGRVVVFDDTFEHEAWNRSAQMRAVLISDIWHPDLTEAEQAAITELVVRVGKFNSACEAL